MIQKLTNSEYIFEKEYIDTQKRDLKAKVVLHIDHVKGTYKITPNGAGAFSFVHDSKNNHQLWIATAQAIEEAIVFAEELVNPIEDIAEIIDAAATLEYKEHE